MSQQHIACVSNSDPTHEALGVHIHPLPYKNVPRHPPNMPSPTARTNSRTRTSMPACPDQALIQEFLVGQLGHESINHVVSEDPGYRCQLMVIPIETKRMRGNGIFALVVWAMSLFRRWRVLFGEDTVFTFPLPMLLVVGDSWTLFFAVDDPEETKLYKFGETGTTETLVGVYKLLKALKAPLEWTMKTYVPLFRKEVLQRASAS